MKEAFKKILDRLEREIAGKPTPDEYNNGINRAYSIVKEVSEEYKGDMKHNLAEMYAKNMVDYGVDVTKEWQTATQQSCALEKAFIRGIQYERDRFIELRKEYNNGWIACSDGLPEEYTVLCCDKYGEMIVGHPYFDEVSDTNYSSESDNEMMYNCIAWQPLPEPYKESED